MAGTVGCQLALVNEMGSLQERVASTKNGSITSAQAIYAHRFSDKITVCTMVLTMFYTGDFTQGNDSAEK